MPRPTKITDELIEHVSKQVRAGCFPTTAAVASGISLTSHHNYMKAGNPLRRKYRDAVLQAFGEARQEAENEVFQTDKRFWLRSGPGKPKPDWDEGWCEANSSKVEVAGSLALNVTWSGASPFADADED